MDVNVDITDERIVFLGLAVYFVNLIYALPLLCILIWYEISGLSGNYRSLINHMVATLSFLTIANRLISIVDALRFIFGPLPPFVCAAEDILKTAATICVGFVLLALVTYRYVVLCHFKSIPVMNDDFIATFVNIASAMLSLVYASLKYFSPGKPVANEVLCLGGYQNEWDELESKFPFDAVVLAINFCLHACMTIPIFLAKNKAKANEVSTTGIANKNRGQISHLGKLAFYSAVVTGLVFAQVFVIKSLNTTSLKSTQYWAPFGLNLVTNSLAVSAYTTYHFVKYKTLRNEARDIFLRVLRK